ncbi:phosphoglycolate phosphatase [mine drainage metagenome]|uniref:Phosphoglycolate phosphatase n=1 Tax=mine drainage metagenome TaxID=410659 RepID=T0Z416_9ZZZZ
MIEVLSFDLDGTLVDTGGEIAGAVNDTLRDFAMAPRAQAEIEALIGAGTRELMRRLLARVDPRQRLHEPAVLRRFEQHYAAHAGSAAQPYPGCVETLRQLRAAGVRLACVTNKEQRHAQRVLDATALAPYFDLLVGGDTLAWKKTRRARAAPRCRRAGQPARARRARGRLANRPRRRAQRRRGRLGGAVGLQRRHAHRTGAAHAPVRQLSPPSPRPCWRRPRCPCVVPPAFTERMFPMLDRPPTTSSRTAHSVDPGSRQPRRKARWMTACAGMTNRTMVHR